VELVFLGSGGGRHVTISQERGTAGFRVSGSARVHVDPGPGYANRCAEFGVSPSDVDVLLLSHAHVDHCNDANVAVEAMTRSGDERRGAVFGAASALLGKGEFDRCVSRYHGGLVKRFEALGPGRSAEFSGAWVEGVKTAHGDPSGVGFIISLDGKRIGYSGDTEFFAGMPALFGGCDALVLNTLQPRGGRIPTHFGTDAAVRLLSGMERKPTLAVIQHFGVQMLRAGPELEAEFIEAESGVRTVAARDGLRLGL
jgi:phosphoribosyl 1,2-cyclic phosphodiesterase